MKKILSLLMLLISSVLTSNDSAADSFATSSLASTEGLMSSIVAGHVSVITGDLICHEQDLTLPGPRPLLHQRTYCSGDAYGRSLYQSWGFIEPVSIFYSQPEYKGDASALVTTPHGARAKFELRLSDKPKGRTPFNYVPTKGYTNCGSGKISGKTNIKNTSLFLNNADKRGNSGEVLSGDGTKQLYTELKQNARNPKWGQYLLNHEINPDRSKKYFFRGPSGSLIELRQVNWADNLVYGWLKSTSIDKNGRSLVVDSSTGKRVTYRFHKKAWSNGKVGSGSR